MSTNYDPKKIGEKHYTLDVKDLTCPYPQVLVTRALDKLSPDDTLEVVLNNPPSARDIPPALKERGHNVAETVTLDQNTWKIIITKK
jgi:Predicted redox protein, regulator of disulfide bond formation